jgi:hypothetical protein
VVDDEACARPEALRAGAVLPVAREHEQVGVRADVDDLLLGAAAAGQQLRRTPKPRLRFGQQRLRLLLGDCPERRPGRRRRTASEEPRSAARGELLDVAGPRAGA